MPRKKQPTINEIVDDLINLAPASNGHDAEGLAEAVESGEIDEPIERTAPRRASKTRAEAQGPEGTPVSVATQDDVEKPVRKRRTPRKSRDPEDERELLRLPLLPL